LDCTRCGAPQKQQTRRRRDEERRRGGSIDSNNEEQQPEKKQSFADALDEFGRLAAKAIPSKKPKVAEEKKIWPPCFDNNGSSFVFDTRSGMFYESGTDFFYDPVSKLYYGNKQGTYYRYDDDKKVFEAVQKVDTAKAEEALLPTSAVDTAAKPSGTQEKKATISIKLKTKSLASAKVQKKSTKTKFKASSVADPAPRVAKKHAADLAKWTERQVEQRQEHKRDSPSPAQDTKTIATTAKGEPICLLCRRKFATLAKLEYHEKASNLHKENLAKQKTNEEAKTPPSSQQNPPGYVDRAQQRRTLYGPESSRIAAPLDVQSVVSLGSQSVVPSSQHDNLGETNIGNQMLQKLGWKNGASLGRKDNNETSDGAPSQQPAAASMKQDWERIESMASKGGKVSRSSGGVGSHRPHGS